MIQLGHKHIWYIGDISVPWYRTRHEAYDKTMTEAGLQPKAQTLGVSDDRFLNGLNCMKMILEQKAPVTSVLAGATMSPLAPGKYQVHEPQHVGGICDRRRDWHAQPRL